jgi:hypothetical protein
VCIFSTLIPLSNENSLSRMSDILNFLMVELKSLKFAAFVLVYILVPTNDLAAQTDQNVNSSIRATVSINATATVVESIEIATLSNISLGSVSVGDIDIFVNPQSDDGAGKLLITGRPDAMIRVNYIPQRELTRSGGTETLLFVYNLSGNSDDSQGNSNLIDASRTDFRLGSNGRFYIWIGGRVDVQNAVFGQYEGEFAIEIEYI